MKKFFAIITSSLILISGMHLSVAKHYCRGEFAAMKISVDGEYATCGMEEAITCKIHGVNTLSQNCCKNELNSIGVDQNYSPSSADTGLFSGLHFAHYAPANYISGLANSISYNYKNISLPDKVFAGAISPADICVFRI